jgi:hypothetical protein
MPRVPPLVDLAHGDFTWCDFSGCTLQGDVGDAVFDYANMFGVW